MKYFAILTIAVLALIGAAFLPASTIRSHKFQKYTTCYALGGSTGDVYYSVYTNSCLRIQEEYDDGSDWGIEDGKTSVNFSIREITQAGSYAIYHDHCNDMDSYECTGMSYEFAKKEKILTSPKIYQLFIPLENLLKPSGVGA